jgi:hypothetical protein
MDFEILGAIRDIETIAAGRALRQFRRLRRRYGPGNGRGLLLFVLLMGRHVKQRYTGTKLMGSADESSRSSFLS